MTEKQNYLAKETFLISTTNARLRGYGYIAALIRALPTTAGLRPIGPV